MMTTHQFAATCTYALRLSDGRFVTDPRGGASYVFDAAHLWLWPMEDTSEQRAARVAEIVKQHPWIGSAVPVRAR